MKNLCVIPARGGSKRIPRKNIKQFIGKPILAYSIEAALKSKLFDEVMVSTDDEDIAVIAKQYGARVPFMRTEATANDYASSDDVLKEVIECYKKKEMVFDNMCCIYATAPMVQSKDIVRGFDLLNSSDFNCVYPVVAFSYPIWRCLDVAENGNLKFHWPKFSKYRSQDLPIVYHDTGTFYWYKIESWLKDGESKGGAIIVAETTVQDIDNETDWKLAEMKYKLLHEK